MLTYHLNYIICIYFIKYKVCKTFINLLVMEHGTTLEPSAIPVKLEHSKYISQVPHTQTHALELYVFL